MQFNLCPFNKILNATQLVSLGLVNAAFALKFKQA